MKFMKNGLQKAYHAKVEAWPYLRAKKNGYLGVFGF